MNDYTHSFSSFHEGEDLIGTVHEAGATIYKPGDPAEDIYIIQSGSVEISFQRNDEKTVLEVLTKNDFFGEAAILQAQKRHSTVRTTRRTCLLRINKHSLLKKMRDDRAVFLHLTKELASRIKRSTRRSSTDLRNNGILQFSGEENAFLLSLQPDQALHLLQDLIRTLRR